MNNLQLDDLRARLKYVLVEDNNNVQVKIDINCQKDIDARKTINLIEKWTHLEGDRKSDYQGLERIYIDEYIPKLAEIGDRNMDKLKFYLDNNPIRLDATFDEIFREADIHKVIYLSNTQMKQRRVPIEDPRIIRIQEFEPSHSEMNDTVLLNDKLVSTDDFAIGHFIWSEYWLTKSQEEYIFHLFDVMSQTAFIIDQVFFCFFFVVDLFMIFLRFS